MEQPKTRVAHERVGVRVMAVSALVAVAACGAEPEPRRLVSAAPFCQTVVPAVDAFLAEAGAARPVPDDPRYGGTVVVGAVGEIANGMNSAVSADHAAMQHQQFVNLMTLLDYDEQANPRPYLAESWEIAEDGTSVTFHIRQDVRWHDGERTDAHDVAFTYLTVTDPATGFPNPAFWDLYVRGEDGVEVLDDFTVRIRLQPHSDFLDPFRTLGILPEHLLGDVPREELSQHPFGTQCPVGNGPFVFWSHEAQDRWTFVANPVFPEALGGRPFLDRYVYRPIPEQTTLLTELLTGGIDVYIQPSSDQAQRIIDAEHLELLRFMDRGYVLIAWNARRPELSDARVRRALTMGFDRETVVEAILQGYGTVANSSVAPFHWAHDPELESPVDYDPEAARRLLTEAGWVDRDGDGVVEDAEGRPLAIRLEYSPNQQRQQMSEVMQAQLAEIGIALELRSVEWTTLLERILSPTRDYDGVILGWQAEFKLDDTDLFHSERHDQPNALAGTVNPEIDRLLEELRTTFDREEARPLWAEYQRVLMEEQPYTFLYFRDRLAGVNRRMKGVEMDVRGDWVNVRGWYVDPVTR